MGEIYFFASGEQYNVISTELMSNILWNLHLKISKKPYLQESSIQLKSKTTYNQIDQVELCFLYHLLAKQLMQICIFIFFGHSVSTAVDCLVSFASAPPSHWIGSLKKGMDRSCFKTGY